MVRESILIYHADFDLSISHIVTVGEVAVCSFYGIDGATPFTVGTQTVDVGPPQVLLSVKCCAFYCEGYPVNNCPMGVNGMLDEK